MKIDINDIEIIGPVYELQEGKKYIMFIDRRVVDLNALIETRSPLDIEMEIIPILSLPGQDIEESIKLYLNKK
jgi:hypothetical protein